MKRIALLGISLLVLPLLFNWSCDENVGPNELNAKYTILGGLVKNLDNDSIVIAASFLKNDSAFSGAMLTLPKDTLKYDSINEVYLEYYSGDTSLAWGNYRMRITDLPWFNDSAVFTIPHDFAISSIQLPDDRVNPGGEPVIFEWQTSLGSDGYAYGVVLKDSAYTGYGYSEFVTAEEGTSTNIPPDAFRVSGNVGGPDTGWYYVYVYAYSESPASEFNLPTAIPAGLANNITKLNFTGKFGAIVVTPHDSIHVTVQN